MTAYVPGRLLVAGFPRSDDAPWLVELGHALGELGLAFRLTRRCARRIADLRTTRGSAAELLDALWVSTIVLESDRGPAPQAWWVLERLRQLRPALADRLSLDEARRPASMGETPLAVAGLGLPA